MYGRRCIRLRTITSNCLQDHHHQVIVQMEEKTSLPLWSGGRMTRSVRRQGKLRPTLLLLTFFSLVSWTWWRFALLAARRQIVFILLPATQSSPRFCKTLASLVLNEYENIIVTNFEGESHHRAKLFSTLDFLQRNLTTAREDDVVIVLDAYDTIAQQPLPYVLNEFRSIDSPIVFSAEKGCHPPDEEWCVRVPDSPLSKSLYGPQTDSFIELQDNRPRWLNSGFVMGKAGAMIRLYEAATSSATEQDGHFTADQSILGPLFTSGRFNITLDYYSQIAQPMFFYEREVHFVAQHDPIAALKREPMRTIVQSACQAVHVDDRTGRFGEKDESQYGIDEEIPSWTLHNVATGTVPAFIHFNLPNKEALDDHWRTYWYGGRSGDKVMSMAVEYVERVGRVKRAEDGQEMRFDQLCPGEWFR